MRQYLLIGRMRSERNPSVMQIVLQEEVRVTKFGLVEIELVSKVGMMHSIAVGSDW